MFVVWQGSLIVGRFGTEKGVMLMRKPACCYVQGRRGARRFRAEVGKVKSVDEFRQVIERYFPRARCLPGS